MPPADAFQYAVLRVVPRVERGECINVGVVLHCRRRRYLGVRVGLARDRLRMLWPDLDPAAVEVALAAIAAVVAGRPDAGQLAALPDSERFGWVVASASTMIQPSEVHTGLTDDPAATLNHLFGRLVELPAGGPARDGP